jgi:hypothetical protein
VPAKMVGKLVGMVKAVSSRQIRGMTISPLDRM